MISCGLILFFFSFVRLPFLSFEVWPVFIYFCCVGVCVLTFAFDVVCLHELLSYSAFFVCVMLSYSD